MSPDDPANGAAATAAPPTRESEEAELGALVACVVADLRAFAASLTSIAALEWQRLRVRAVDAVLKVALLLLLGVGGAAVAIAAGVLLVAGLRDALVHWTGVTWVGELGASAFVLIGLALAGQTLRSVVRRRLVQAAIRPRTSGSGPGAGPGTGR